MYFYYDALDETCKSIRGAIIEGDELKITVKSSGVEKCRLIMRYDEESECGYDMIKSDGNFSITLINLKTGLLWYHFEADGVVFGNDGLCVAKENSDENFQLSVCKKRDDICENHGRIMYQIMPDRFKRANGYGSETGKKMKKWGEMPDFLPNEKGKITNEDFFGGNLEGIRREIPYLKSLGVNCIYLNPIFKAKSNHRYDTGDYSEIDSLLGDFDDFVRLVTDCKNNDICIILDGVFNHTGDDSLYFNKYGNYKSVGAYESKKSPYYKWYTFEEFPDKYVSWWGIDTLPTINKNCDEFEDFIAGQGGVLDRYLSLGAGGIRLDVVDEIPDTFVQKIYKCIKKYGNEKLIIGEVWEDATNKIAYDKRRSYFIENELDGVMNYPLKNAIINFVISGSGDELYSVVRNQLDHYPVFALNNLMNILGTHDTPRILTVLGKNGKLAKERSKMANESLTRDEIILAVKRLKCASLLQFLLYGFPSVYYGDETGMQGNADPFNRKCFDKSKTNDDILSWYKKLSEIRTDYDCLKTGKVFAVRYKSGVFSFSKKSDHDVVTVVVNCGLKAADVRFNDAVNELTRGIKCNKMTVNTYDFAVFYKMTNQG